MDKQTKELNFEKWANNYLFINERYTKVLVHERGISFITAGEYNSSISWFPKSDPVLYAKAYEMLENAEVAYLNKIEKRAIDKNVLIYNEGE